MARRFANPINDKSILSFVIHACSTPLVKGSGSPQANPIRKDTNMRRLKITLNM
jgi:hypothetical protein